jgi:hypothetical protein
MKALRSLLALVFVLSLTLMSVSPVASAKPIITGGDADWHHLLDPQPCPGFEVWDHEILTWSAWDYYDAEGNWVRYQLHVSGTDNVYNPANPGVVLSANFVGKLVFTRDGELLKIGIPYHFTVPGYGAVYVEAGRWFADGRIVGHHDSIEPGGLDAFCSLLAGD